MDESKALKNKRHEAFCLQYVGMSRMNGSAAYKAAGYRCAADTARRMAARLLARQDVAARVRHLEDEMAEREKLRALDAIRHLKAVATVTLADFLAPDGRIDTEKLHDPWLMQAVAKLTPIYGDGGVLLDYKLELKDSMRALELLGLTKRKEPQGAGPQILVIKA